MKENRMWGKNTDIGKKEKKIYVEWVDDKPSAVFFTISPPLRAAAIIRSICKTDKMTGLIDCLLPPAHHLHRPSCERFQYQPVSMIPRSYVVKSVLGHFAVVFNYLHIIKSYSTTTFQLRGTRHEDDHSPRADKDLETGYCTCLK